ncbi:hypothetical protein HPP92_012719 [Vanilla planifolia]|uniref:FAD/NAD(P)-binding domain-containing protein n=1 Tax=Vanilla planifolia TaxID=51239 RepID=A0A835UZB2_VANPL|nr:hypothetical protein HPP92_012719 [Vanilla planifolia]
MAVANQAAAGWSFFIVQASVCILGGGFGGLYTALRLESLVWPDDKKPQVLLVDQSDKFVFKPMLYELLSGEVDPWEIAPAFKELLKTRLVLALGAAAKLDAVPGSAEFAYPFITLADAILKLLERKHFGKDSSPISVAIVGCGYSGVELAATISERLQEHGIVQAINVQTSICPSAPSGNRESALKVLSSRNTKLYLGYYELNFCGF